MRMILHGRSHPGGILPHHGGHREKSGRDPAAILIRLDTANAGRSADCPALVLSSVKKDTGAPADAPVS